MLEHRFDFDGAFKGITNHVKRHKVVYAFGAGIAVTGITFYFTRNVSFRQGNVTVRALNLLSNRPSIVTVIENGRQGPPSWVVRCLETNEIFTSQRAASIVKGITETHISKHLNGGLENAGGLHFERICLAA